MYGKCFIVLRMEGINTDNSYWMRKGDMKNYAFGYGGYYLRNLQNICQLFIGSFKISENVKKKPPRL